MNATQRARRSDALFSDHAYHRRTLCDRIAWLESELEGRTARRVIVADGATDCATGYCRCGSCGHAIDPWDHYCRSCGARLEDQCI